MQSWGEQKSIVAYMPKVRAGRNTSLLGETFLCPTDESPGRPSVPVSVQGNLVAWLTNPIFIF